VKEITMIRKNENYFPQELSGICVVRRKEESFEDLLKRFRKKYSKSGIAKELKEKMSFEKPSDRRRRKKMQSIRAQEREEEKLKKFKERSKKKFKKGDKKDDSSNRDEDRGRSFDKDED
jgi:small subunit ribosomal protein S21